MTVFIVKNGESIQNAINGAKVPDTIRIEAGTFAGFVVANTTGEEPIPIPRLKIIGAGIGKTIIDGVGSTTDGIALPSGSDQTTIECLTVQNFSAGNGLVSVSNANIIRQVEAKGNGGSGGFNIEGERNLVLKCVASGNQDDGFAIDGNNNYLIECRAIDNMDEGFESDEGGTHTLYFNCLAKGNGSDGFEVGDFDLLLCNKTINNGTEGIELDEDGALVFDNVVCENKDNGILVEECDGIIYGNHVCDNGTGPGIRLESFANRNNVVNNCVQRNKIDGIRLESDPATRSLLPRVRNKLNLITLGTGASNNLIDNNIVKENEGDGILLQSDTTGNCVRSNCAFGNACSDIQANPPANVNNTFDENKCGYSDPDNLCEDCCEVKSVITVKPGESIQCAINAAEPCDTIRIETGTFAGFVVANTTDPMNPIPIPRLRIIGAGIGKTIIDGVATFTDGIVIPLGSDQTTIECLTVQKFGSDGIRIESDANIIRQVESKDNQSDGFFVTEDGHRNFILKCVASGNQDQGVQINGNNNYLIKCQAVENVSDGLASAGGSHTLYFKCLAEGNGFGIFPGDFDVLLHNLVIKNGEEGIDGSGIGNLTFENTICETMGKGIDVVGETTLYGNKVFKNGVGIELDLDDNGNNIINNLVEGNKTGGIRLESGEEEGASNNLIDNNIVKDNENVGIWLEPNTTDNCVRSNCAFNNAGNDIQANPPADDNNTFDENKCGTSDPDGLCEDC
ncbi:right-handed parallel beta-helix repeat-containing protein [Jeotgalibacillus marinus]|uniref:Right-handed parallel beta-helix repeat-containing protein n=1 Tax=Jeotgalibacillus marinus TaxID=86667 RepID=A0ABV3Q434_9BACL